MEHESLTNGYVDLATHCMNLFASIIFATDFREIMKQFFTPTWYSSNTMAQIIANTPDDFSLYPTSLRDAPHARPRARAASRPLACPPGVPPWR